MELISISISKIAVPESQEKDIPPERHEAIFNSLTEKLGVKPRLYWVTF
ncbi:MAG: hypothetical protein MGG11_00690 [Trichodesmium sp. MAG_R03]|nr:hypothetical protein [Trichodesmium sp. MAG_R03]